MAGILALGLPLWAQPNDPPKGGGGATPLTLDECIAMGMQQQPSLAAARASLSAAQTGSRALNRMIIPRLFVPDLPIRRQQGCLGVTIASASLTQAEWDTRYAITRNFFTVQYVNMQRIVVDDTLRNLDASRKKAQRIYESGDKNVKITKIDLEMLDISLAQVKNKKAQIENGMLKAMAALREAMGIGCDDPIEIAATGLPGDVYKVKQESKDDKGKVVTTYTFHRLYKMDKKDLIAQGLANRGEMTQASTADEVVRLEAEAQRRIRGWKGGTFAQGADLHVTPVPLMYANHDYKPGAFAPEMPTMIVGRKNDRVARAWDFAARSAAVVSKTSNLISLDVEVQFLNWQEAAEDIEELSAIVDLASSLPKRVQDLDPIDFTGTAVIQANIQAIQVRAQLNEARHSHALALAGLERATAGGFSIYPVPAPPTK
jgi:outer membrane protein TolC